MFLGRLFHSAGKPGSKLGMQCLQKFVASDLLREAQEQQINLPEPRKMMLAAPRKGGFQLSSSSWKESLDSGETLSTAQERGLSLVKMPGTKMGC